MFRVAISMFCLWQACGFCGWLMRIALVHWLCLVVRLALEGSFHSARSALLAGDSRAFPRCSHDWLSGHFCGWLFWSVVGTAGFLFVPPQNRHISQPSTPDAREGLGEGLFFANDAESSSSPQTREILFGPVVSGYRLAVLDLLFGWFSLRRGLRRRRWFVFGLRGRVRELLAQPALLVAAGPCRRRDVTANFRRRPVVAGPSHAGFQGGISRGWLFRSLSRRSCRLAFAGLLRLDRVAGSCARAISRGPPASPRGWSWLALQAGDSGTFPQLSRLSLWPLL